MESLSNLYLYYEKKWYNGDMGDGLSPLFAEQLEEEKKYFIYDWAVRCLCVDCRRTIKDTKFQELTEYTHFGPITFSIKAQKKG